MKNNLMLPEILQAEAEKKWQEFRFACETSKIAPIDNPEIAAEIKRIFAFSDFIARSCICLPEKAVHLIQSGELQRPYDEEEYTRKLKTALNGIKDEASLNRVLRRLRTYEMVRIAWRDLSGRANLTQTMAELSALADACLEETLALLYEWQCSTHGIPFSADGLQQYLIVLAMGKLGASELNFSSDIDLIFVYPENGETQSAVIEEMPLRQGIAGAPVIKSISNEEFFVRLSRRLINVIGAKTSDGIVFRVDTRLRPYGESGPIVINFESMVDYYQQQGREWERYALIKARVAAGDKIAGARLMEKLNPFIYRKYLDFSAFESLRDMKRMISLEVSRKGLKDNIKIGPGGIREIEFFGQIFQLIRGGIEITLQERGIQNVLHLLVEKNYIPAEVCNELENGYIFLRKTEHCLQEYADGQTHDLSPDPIRRIALAVAMGFDTWESFSECLNRHRERIHEHFNRLLETKDLDTGDTIDETELESVWSNLIDKEHCRDVLSKAGFDRPDDVLNILEDLQNELDSRPLIPEGRKRIDNLIPKVLKKTGRVEQPVITLSQIISLIKAVERRTSYISLLLEYPTALTHLVRLVNASPWIATFLKNHPVLLDELLDTRTLYVPPKRSELESEIHQRLKQISSGDLENQMETLRLFKQSNVLRVAAADITNAMPLMKVSDHLSDIAETVLNAAVETSWNHLVEKHGTPVCRLDDELCNKGFTVIAYGKLGALELSYGSDIDLVFLHAGTQEYTTGENYSIDSPQFYARLGQRVIHVLTAHTYGGVLYETDMRLRPDGSSGILVSHIESFRKYQLEKAWTWEKQALIKARPVSGGGRLKNRFEQIRKEVLAQPRNEDKLKEDVKSMREKMREKQSNPSIGFFDLKQGFGGMVDVEFLVQYLVLRHAWEHPDLLRWTDNVRLIRTLMDAGVIDDVTAYFLRKAFLTYRSVTHRLNLQEKPALVAEDRFRILREKVIEAWNRFLSASPHNKGNKISEFNGDLIRNAY